MGLLPLSKHTYRIVCPTSTTWICSVTLNRRLALDLLVYSQGTGNVHRLPNAIDMYPITFDFFSLHRSHALHTLLRTLLSEWGECSEDGLDCRAVMADW